MSSAPVGPPRVTWRTLSRPAKRWVLAALAVLTLGGLEVAARAYWIWAGGVPFGRPDLAWKALYPEWDRSGVEAVAPYHGDDTFDVLLLGASTLTEQFGPIAPELRRQLAGRVPWP